jgi:glyoxylase-like metal-dependent hydrolase (beta-lactamase superfamily II)
MLATLRLGKLMGSYRLLSRRTAVSEMGKAGLAIVVFGAAACAPGSNGEPDETTTGSPDSTIPSTSSSTSGPEPASTPPEAGSMFHRVNLGFVSAYILYRGGEAALVDTGVDGSASSIEAALSEVGLGWDSVGQVILTHKHPDHIGSVGAVIEAAPGAALYAGAADIPAIDAATPVSPVGDGDRVFDLDIIESPGHTPGHISVLDPIGGVMVTGDALNGEGGGVVGANPRFTEDMALADSSIIKLAGFDYEVALFGHGEPILERASAAVAELATTL